uniref:Uncharacterized protein n=1 Tax=Anguilla anguilla TaxID=7936 RepID=A0A0E9Q3A4_ANGAN
MNGWMDTFFLLVVNYCYCKSQRVSYSVESMRETALF